MFLGRAVSASRAAYVSHIAIVVVVVTVVLVSSSCHVGCCRNLPPLHIAGQPGHLSATLFLLPQLYFWNWDFFWHICVEKVLAIFYSLFLPFCCRVAPRQTVCVWGLSLLWKHVILLGPMYGIPASVGFCSYKLKAFGHTFICRLLSSVCQT